MSHAAGVCSMQVRMAKTDQMKTFKIEEPAVQEVLFCGNWCVTIGRSRNWAAAIGWVVHRSPNTNIFVLRGLRHHCDTMQRDARGQAQPREGTPRGRRRYSRALLHLDWCNVVCLLTVPQKTLNVPLTLMESLDDEACLPTCHINMAQRNKACEHTPVTRPILIWMH
jgi:hypothetical protein